jgi:signal transduction histidine kinase
MATSGELEAIVGLIDEMSAIAQQVLKETRLMIYRMRPAVLEEEGLVGALRRRLGAVEGRVGIRARVVTDTLIQPPAAVEAELYHIAQEALGNALRHAQATLVEVHLRTEGEYLVLEVTDNGCGFDLEAVRDLGGMGLSNMRERAERLGGTLAILSEPGRGTTVRVKLSLAFQADPTTSIYQST